MGLLIVGRKAGRATPLSRLHSLFKKRTAGCLESTVSGKRHSIQEDQHISLTAFPNTCTITTPPDADGGCAHQHASGGKMDHGDAEQQQGYEDDFDEADEGYLDDFEEEVMGQAPGYGCAEATAASCAAPPPLSPTRLLQDNDDQQQHHASPGATTQASYALGTDQRVSVVDTHAWPSLGSTAVPAAAPAARQFARPLFLPAAAQQENHSATIIEQPLPPPLSLKQRRQAASALTRAHELAAQHTLALSTQLELLVVPQLSLQDQFARGMGVFAGRAVPAACQTRQLNRDVYEQDAQTDDVSQGCVVQACVHADGGCHAVRRAGVHAEGRCIHTLAPLDCAPHRWTPGLAAARCQRTCTLHSGMRQAGAAAAASSLCGIHHGQGQSLPALSNGQRRRCYTSSVARAAQHVRAK